MSSPKWSDKWGGVMHTDTTRFHTVFFEEAREHLECLETGLLALQRDPLDTATLQEVFRAAHSLKGASGTFGFKDIASLTHHLEDLLERMRTGRVSVASSTVQLLLSAVDTLGALVAAAHDGNASTADVEKVVAAMEQAASSESMPDASQGSWRAMGSQDRDDATPGLAEYVIHFNPAGDLLRPGIDPLRLLAQLAEVGHVMETSTDTSRLPALDDLIPDDAYLGWRIRLRSDRGLTAIRDVFEFVDDSAHVAVVNVPEPASPPAWRALDSTTIRVSVQKVDALINLVGELVIAQSAFQQALDHAPVAEMAAVHAALNTLSRTTRNLQEQVMSVRMVPLARVFQRFPRLIHDLAVSLNKDVQVEISGEDRELDRQMIEQLMDPLTHLVRNAVDHGIESPDERERLGKARTGTIRLDACQEGGNVIIEVTDDGRGLNTERIRERALSQGHLTFDTPLSEAETQSLIFLPGISTAETVNDVSGRGVGMDVVKRNIEALNGSVQVRSVTGRGTTCRVRLPLTMAIMDGLASGLGGEVYILPLRTVVESFRPGTHDIRQLAGGREIVMVRGTPLPLVRLYQIFQVDRAVTDPTKGLVIIVENQEKRLGLLVDELHGEMQVVMKSLETHYERVEGLSAATVLGDGQIAFVLDVPGISRLAGIRDGQFA